METIFSLFYCYCFSSLDFETRFLWQIKKKKLISIPSNVNEDLATVKCRISFSRAKENSVLGSKLPQEPRLVRGKREVRERRRSWKEKFETRNYSVSFVFVFCTPATLFLNHSSSALSSSPALTGNSSRLSPVSCRLSRSSSAVSGD